MDLPQLLAFAVGLDDGDCASFEESVRRAFFADKAKNKVDPDERRKAQGGLARNVLTSMRNYGLYDIEPTCRLTEFGRGLAAIADPGTQLKALAHHILTELPGLDLLRAIGAVQQRGEHVNKETLAAELVRAGFFQARASTHMTAMAAWLRAAGVLGPPDGWTIHRALVADLSGVDFATVDSWSGLSRTQRSFLQTLRRLGETSGTSPLRATYVNDQVELEHGLLPANDKLRSQVYLPLASAGWVEIAPAVKGKSGTIAPTLKLLNADLATLTRLTSGQLPAELRPLMNTPMQQIRRDLHSSDTHVKGIALELLAVRLATDLGLLAVHFRLRGPDSTGGGEVDLVAEGAHLHFSRWLFQCKNTSTVGLAIVAREVGMAALLRAGVVVIVTTGRFASSVKPFVDAMNSATMTQVFLVDGAMLARYESKGPASIAEMFREFTLQVMSARRPHLDTSLDRVRVLP